MFKGVAAEPICYLAHLLVEGFCLLHILVGILMRNAMLKSK